MGPHKTDRGIMMVQEALNEIRNTLNNIAKEHEGLRDFARLNLQPETLAKVQELLNIYDARVALLIAAFNALEALINHGHPNLDVFEVVQSVFNDLKNNNDTIDAAFAKFKPIVAGSLNLTAGIIERKPIT